MTILRLWHLVRIRMELLSIHHNFQRHAVVLRSTAQNCSKVRAARAARLFFRIRPIRSFITGLEITTDTVAKGINFFAFAIN